MIINNSFIIIVKQPRCAMKYPLTELSFNVKTSKPKPISPTDDFDLDDFFFREDCYDFALLVFGKSPSVALRYELLADTYII